MTNNSGDVCIDSLFWPEKNNQSEGLHNSFTRKAQGKELIYPFSVLSLFHNLVSGGSYAAY